jgi:hypothetical protein
MLEQIQKQADEDIQYPTGDIDGPCGGGWHTDSCEAIMECPPYGCMWAKVERAKLQLRNIDGRHMLLKCVRSGRAEGIRALKDGWVQGSCIIHAS